VKELQAQNRKLSKAMAAQRRSHQQAKERLESRIAELEQRALNHRCGYLGRIVP
jgi:predicted  nucleic acid-binding Zn-ribbon protein